MSEEEINSRIEEETGHRNVAELLEAYKELKGIIDKDIQGELT